MNCIFEMDAFFSAMFLVLIAASLPGPNIILVTQNSLAFGRKGGMVTASGLVFGIIFWYVALVIGFAYIMQRPKILFIFHVLGSLYFLYISYLIFQIKVDFSNTQANMHNKAFFAEGVFSTLLNAEVPIFYGSILTGILTATPEIANSPLQILLYFMGFMCVESLVFFSAAWFVSGIRRFVVNYFNKIKIFASCAVLYFALRMIYNTYNEYQLIF